MQTMKSVLCWCFFNLFITYCLALIGGNKQIYNPRLTSLVLVTILSQNEDIIMCTGTLISDTLVLTAADCLKYYYEKFGPLGTKGFVYIKAQTNLVYNSTDYKFQIVDFKISGDTKKEEPFSIPDYQPYDQIALLKIFPPVNFTEMRIVPAKLSRTNKNPQILLIAGLGADESMQPHKFNWAIVPTTPCPTANEYNFAKTICWRENETSVTLGDAGGPALDENYEIAGVLSFNGLLRNDHDIVFLTKISEKKAFLDWAIRGLNNLK